MAIIKDEKNRRDKKGKKEKKIHVRRGFRKKKVHLQRDFLFVDKNHSFFFLAI